MNLRKNFQKPMPDSFVRGRDKVVAACIVIGTIVVSLGIVLFFAIGAVLVTPDQARSDGSSVPAVMDDTTQPGRAGRGDR